MAIRSISGKPGAAIAQEILLVRAVLEGTREFVGSRYVKAELKANARIEIPIWESILGRLEVLEQASRGGGPE